MMKLDTFRPQLIQLLEQHPRIWCASYTIWARFKERFPREAQELIEEYHGRIGAGGSGPGGNYGMVSQISQSLAHEPKVEKAHLRTEGLTFGDVRPSDPTIAIFRLKRDASRVE